MTTLAPEPGLAGRIAAVKRPAPRPGAIASALVFVLIVGLGVWSFIRMKFSFGDMIDSLDNLPRFIDRATPLVWPGFHWDKATETMHWVGWAAAEGSGFRPDETISHAFLALLMTLGIVISGTFLASLISIPVAYGAARNTTPNGVVLVICRGVGVIARAIPDVAFACIFVYIFALGPLPGVLAIMFHSVGMISKMMADAIEQIDEGPRLALQSTGGSKGQQFWGGVVPQAFPAWVAVALHRADINLRGTAILGYVGVGGLGYELSTWIHVLNYQRAFPYAIIIIVLCILFEVISSVVRARMLGVRPQGKGLGDAIVRSAARRSRAVEKAITKPGLAPEVSEARTQAIHSAMKRPWTGERIATTFAMWTAIVIVIGSFFAAQAKWGQLFTFWGNLGVLVNKDNFWPPSFGSNYTFDVVREAVLVTLSVAFAATLGGAILSVIIGSLAARNAAPARWVRSLFRLVLLIIRGIPELILAIIFVIVLGLGTQVGTLALIIGGVGLMGKLIADSLEEVPHGPELAVEAVGGSRLQIFFSSTLPQGIPAVVAHTFYLLEQNVRAATLLGIVGGGGIGFLLYDSLRVAKYNQVFALVGLIIVMVLIIEAAANLIRRVVK